TMTVGGGTDQWDVRTAGGTCGVSSTGLAGYWKFNEASGNAADSGPNNIVGTIMNGPTYAAAKVSNGINLNGSSRHVAMGNPAALNVASAGTLAAWIRLNSLVGWGPIISKLNWGADLNGYILGLNGSGNGLFAMLADGSGETDISGGTTLS